MHPNPAQGACRLPVYQGCVFLLLVGKGSEGDDCASSGRNMGGGSSIFLSALGERRDVYSASFATVGWGGEECLTLFP